MKSLIHNLLQLPKKSVIVLGDVGVDEYIFGTVSRVSPEAPVPVVRELRREKYFGCAANTAVNCKALGLDVALIGVVNNEDAGGEAFTHLLQDAHLPPDTIVFSSTRKTTFKTRVIAQNHHCLRIDNEDVMPLNAIELSRIIDLVKVKMRSSSIILLSDYAKGVVTHELVQEVVRVAHAHGGLVFADPKGPNFDKYQGVDYLKPNVTEFNQMVQFFGIEKKLSLVEQGIIICAKLRLQGLIITLGDRGIQYISQSESIFSPAFKREVFDLSGAGDTVFAYLAFSIVHGLSMHDALALANKAASIAISHLKTYAVRLEELVNGVDNHEDKVLFDWGVLKNKIDAARARGKRIVFTNGCFDLLHPGHVRCLREAKKQGDILLVALNSDASVRRQNKGPERPLNSLEDRAAIIAGLESVDFVTSFEQDTPQNIIDLLLPDVLVKGGDYIAEDVVGYNTVTANGGRVCIVPLVEGKSTTKIVKKARTLDFSI